MFDVGKYKKNILLTAWSMYPEAADFQCTVEAA